MYIELNGTLWRLINFYFFLLTDERDAIQKKTFTKWVNKHLRKVNYFKFNYKRAKVM